MLTILVISSFFAAIYYTYLAVENFRIFEYGTHAVATVNTIEKTIDHDQDGREFEYYWLLLDLPDYEGVPLGKRYEKHINPQKYFVGEQIEIIQKQNAPTEIIIKKELSPLNLPQSYLVYAVMLFIFSYLFSTH